MKSVPPFLPFDFCLLPFDFPGRRLAAVLLTATLLAQTPAQQPTIVPTKPRVETKVGPKQEEFVLRTTADLVLVDVKVTGKDGKPVKGLKTDQFRILEDGKPQRISSFDYYDIETLETATADTSKPIGLSLGSVAEPEKVKELVRDRRLIVLFFDLTSLQPDELLRSVDSADEYLKKQMTKADLVGIVTFGNRLNVLANFTNDRDALQAAIARLRPGKDSALAETGEGETENAAAFSADDTEFNIFNTDRKLAAVQDLSNLLRLIPGKKQVVQFTGGLSQTGEDNRSAVRAAIDAANRANVSLYTVDARGLQAMAPGGDASTGAAAGTAMFSGQAVFRQQQSRRDSQETLSTLATDTGGRVFTDEGDFREVFTQVQADSAGYYLLGYTSTNQKMDGRWRQIRVRVELPGTRMVAREGYFAPKDFKIYNTEDRERQLADAMAAESARHELPVVVEATHFRMQGRAHEIYVPVAAKLASSALDWSDKKGSKEARFDFAAEIREERSQRVVGALRDVITVKLDSERFKSVQQRALVYEGGVILGPGHYRLKFLARENETGRIGTFEQKLVIPPSDENRLELSSLLLSSQVEPVRQTREVQTRRLARDARLSRTPLEVAGDRVIPSVTRVFTTDQNLYVVFQAYAPPKSDLAKLRAGLVMFRNGVRSSDTPLVAPAEIDEKTRTASFRISLPLEKLPPGRYTLQAITVEPGGGHAAFSRSFFALRKAVAKTASTGF
jgi:VWFA-related protein